MRRILVTLTVLGLLTPAALPSPASGQAGPGYFKTDNVEYVKTLPQESDTAGAAVHGKYLYLTTARALSIYDLEDPENPVLQGALPLPQQPQFSEEDPDTNGKILLIGTLGTLYVVDVEDKTNPKIIGELPGADNHTISCVLDCKWGYGSEGIIVDLRDPSKPKLAGNWGKGKPTGESHDVTEVSPGMIVTSSQPLMLLDARNNPTSPKLLATGSTQDNRFMHGNEWPRRGNDKFLLVGGESVGDCGTEDSAAFMVWDTTKWQETKRFTMLDELRMKNGNPAEGDAAFNSFCAHWFQEHPTFRNGGLVAMAWYEHGTRFLQVTPEGKIVEKGWFLPVGGATSASYWITDRIVYAVDYQRGLDILRYTGKSFFSPGSGGGGSQLPGPRLVAGVSDRTPRFGTTITFRTRLRVCKGHSGTNVELQRKKSGGFVTIAQKKLNRRCRARIRVPAEFREATFRAVWPKQHDDHRRGRSGKITIRTHR